MICTLANVHGSKRNIGSLAKYPVINYTAFSCNNISKFFDYQILAVIFVLNLNKQIPKMPFFLLIFYCWSWDFFQAPGSASHTEYYPWISHTAEFDIFLQILWTFPWHFNWFRYWILMKKSRPSNPLRGWHT